MKASFRIFSETLPRGGVFRFSSAAKGTQRSPRMGKELPVLETRQDFSMKACFQSALSNLTPSFLEHTLATVLFQLRLCNRFASNFQFARR